MAAYIEADGFEIVVRCPTARTEDAALQALVDVILGELELERDMSVRNRPDLDSVLAEYLAAEILRYLPWANARVTRVDWTPPQARSVFG